MKLSIESIATLAATSQVTAWYVTFYDNTERCEVDGETEYQILEGEQSDCNTFAASIDGVDCIHFVEGGRNINKEPGQCVTTLEMSLTNGEKPDIASFRCVS
ncbi:hypothetical protein FOC4_g10005772 [Fusarium odoratissimum]|uniref:Uncharacterized protein n=1 Tax=Fusarium oxysporum f. sp. cubense (strain race 4) TaxID=2502994 RepID=N1RZI7_FUSC4|nr:hypothetical protein FOC4_g10005772 [Fusarium odoratissimum]